MTQQKHPEFEMMPVKSSNLKEIGWDKKTKTLKVTFYNLDSYLYQEVSKPLWLAFQLAKSHGKFFFEHIKSNVNIKVTKL